MFQDGLSSGDQITTVVLYLLGGCIRSYYAVISTRGQELSVWYTWHHLEREVQRFAPSNLYPWETKKERHQSGLVLAVARVWGKGKTIKRLYVLLKNMFRGNQSRQATPSCQQRHRHSHCSSGRSTGPQPVCSCTHISLRCQGHGDAGGREMTTWREPNPSHELVVL